MYYIKIEPETVKKKTKDPIFWSHGPPLGADGLELAMAPKCRIVVFWGGQFQHFGKKV